MVKFIPFEGGVRPFSAAVRAGSTLYVSGQVGIDRSSGTYPETIESQTECAVHNLQTVLEKEGYSLSDVVKMTVLLTNAADLSAFNNVYTRFFATNPPARTLCTVKALAGPAIVELDAVAYQE
ncbi:RidA family protein [Oscillibacter sp. MSJ-2]|uniref:RidA family protein n=1 Tax=Dysosmobacter acutus TaxID=2841504 RepID=A0ABS6FAM6_9FIRM|nr:RidA family protein [Dysosmobacter acutus]MBU5627110.1 RidA family protein [Dysosmobacter acutus]